VASRALGKEFSENFLRKIRFLYEIYGTCLFGFYVTSYHHQNICFEKPIRGNYL
jgi:hypothetical protein